MKLRRHPAWWDACAFCPNDSQPQNGRDAGERNVFVDGDLLVEGVYGKRWRRVHVECLVLAVRAGFRPGVRP